MTSARKDVYICGLYRINKRWFVYVWFRGMCEVPVWATITGAVWTAYGLHWLVSQLSEVSK